MVLTILAAFAYLSVLQKTYAATAKVRVSAPMSAKDAPSNDDPLIDTSGTILDKPATVADATNLAGEKSSPGFAGSVTLVPDPEEPIAFITATGLSPEQAQKRASAWARAYINAMQVNKSSIAANLAAEAQKYEKLQRDLDLRAASDPVAKAKSSALGERLGGIYALLNGKFSEFSVPPAALLAGAPLGAPTTPGAKSIVLMGALVGLLAGCGLALLREQFDTRVRARADLETLTGGSPILGELAFQPGMVARPDSLPSAGRARTAFTEGVRELRTSVQVMSRDHATPVILLTSPESGDGKSFISANLAVSWARTGKKVILLEADLRRPGICPYFSLNAAEGGLSSLLGNALESRARAGEHADSGPSLQTVAAALRPTHIEGLWVLPAGPATNEPADLLASDAMRVTVAHLRSLADAVIVDSPPVFALADGIILARNVDGVVLVASAKRTKRSRLTDSLKRLVANQATVYGVALNRAQVVLPKSYDVYLGQSVDAAQVDRGPADARATAPDGLAREAGRTRHRSAGRGRSSALKVRGNPLHLGKITGTESGTTTNPVEQRS